MDDLDINMFLTNQKNVSSSTVLRIVEVKKQIDRVKTVPNVVSYPGLVHPHVPTNSLEKKNKTSFAKI